MEFYIYNYSGQLPHQPKKGIRAICSKFPFFPFPFFLHFLYYTYYTCMENVGRKGMARVRDVTPFRTEGVCIFCYSTNFFWKIIHHFATVWHHVQWPPK